VVVVAVVAMEQEHMVMAEAAVVLVAYYMELLI
jgi:hypothetical protein